MKLATIEQLKKDCDTWAWYLEASIAEEDPETIRRDLEGLETSVKELLSILDGREALK